MHIIGKCQVGIGIQFFCFFVESLIVRKDLRFFIIFSSGQIKLSLSGRYCFPDRFYRIFLMDHTSFYFREHLVSLFLWKIIGQLRIHRSNLLLRLEETHSIYLCSKCLLIDPNTACQFILKSLKKADRPHPGTLSVQICLQLFKWINGCPQLFSGPHFLHLISSLDRQTVILLSCDHIRRHLFRCHAAIDHSVNLRSIKIMGIKIPASHSVNCQEQCCCHDSRYLQYFFHFTFSFPLYLQ